MPRGPIVRWPSKMGVGMYQAGRASLDEARAASAKRLPSAEHGELPGEKLPTTVDACRADHEEFLADDIVQPPLPPAAKLSKTKSSLRRALTLLKTKNFSPSKQHQANAARSEEPQKAFSPSAAFRIIRGVLTFKGMIASKASVQIAPDDTDHGAVGVGHPPANLDEAIALLNALGKDDDWRLRE
jgi:hypothetical protein